VRDEAEAGRVEALLKDLQNAVGARLLYPPEHPRLREGFERLQAQVRELTTARPELGIFVLDDRVVFADAPLPGAEIVAKGLFGTLRSCGYDRLAIRRGIEPGELEAFLDALAEVVRRGEAVPGMLRPSAHLSFSSLEDQPEAEPPPSAAGGLSAEVQALKGVWTGIVQERALDVEGLEGIVLALSKTVEENLGALVPMAALKSHDEYTATHIANVALLAMALGESIGLPPPVVHDLGIAALLHDVGKLQVPHDILNKPDQLTEAQLAAVRKHPEEGARTLLATRGVPDLAVEVAYEHHIRADGAGGYPAVPRGWKLSLASAITQIADIYDALRTDRPYRKGLARDLIADMMTADAGTHFDRDLLAAFFEDVVPRTSGAG
jgi:HD-GYP domain-containing protein (c-di-GMP phosphodiesterase class II)